MNLKTIVDAYLVANYDHIEEARNKSDFSWKPIINDMDSSLDAEDKRIREYVRKRFLELRRKDSKKIEDVQEIKSVKKVEISSKREEEYKHIDTYNKPKFEPKTEEEEFQVWKQQKDRLKNQVGLHVVVGCVHLPAVNKKMFNAFLNFLKDVRPDLKGIHLIGDILDCKSLSQHDNGQVSDTTLDKEYEESNKYLDQIDEILPSNIEKNYLWGNHEQRYERMIKRSDVAKFGGALLSPTKGCKFIERGYTVQEDYKNAKIQLGKFLDLVHGEYVVSNAAKKHLDINKGSIMFAHTHKLGSHYDCDRASFNIGWMGDSENPAFGYCSRLAKSQWQNGFAIVNIDDQGYYHVQLIQYYNDRFYYGGKEYK